MLEQDIEQSMASFEKLLHRTLAFVTAIHPTTLMAIASGFSPATDTCLELGQYQCDALTKGTYNKFYVTGGEL